ncbi:hypothetical protein I6F26_10250 [Ensifer sp. IC3342]|nr:hypothetical protein [Ensifer sp. BRP08]MCA1446960.1 hypothetical protein [Ensifer sp. IC3342]
MKKALIAALAALPLAGCIANPEGLRAEFSTISGKPVPPKTLAYAARRCDERFQGIGTNQAMAYGLENVDVTGLIDDAKACMRRHGIVVKGWRQKDGRLTPYPVWPKYMDY